jgi:hypothetical protein
VRYLRATENRKKIENMKKIIYFFAIILIFQNSFGQQTKVFDSINNQFKKIKLECKIKSNNKKILNLFDDFYSEMLEADNGNLSQNTISEYNEFQNNRNIPNWHIFYLFNIYQNHITESVKLNKQTDSDFQISVMKILSGELLATYKTIPPLILIYMGEALMSGNRNELAKNHFKMLLEFYPKSIPIKVYNYLLLEDGTEKEKLYKVLKTENPYHWMVIEKLK